MWTPSGRWKRAASRGFNLRLQGISPRPILLPYGTGRRRDKTAVEGERRALEADVLRPLLAEPPQPPVPASIPSPIGGRRTSASKARPEGSPEASPEASAEV